MSESDEPSLDPTDAAERRTLLLVLGINFAQFAVAGVVGVIASSSGLLAVALDITISFIFRARYSHSGKLSLFEQLI